MGLLRQGAGLVALLAMAAGALALPSHFEDPLERPAQISDLALRAPVLGTAAAGSALIAVGQRGHILRQSSPTSPWHQVRVPVSTDLVAVAFPSPDHGWAVGHDGIVLSTRDGGVTWQRRLDGHMAYEIELSHYEALAARGDATALRELRFLKRMASQAPARPFLDVWFKSDKDGYLVGAFGMVFRTSDGGSSWVPMAERTDNPKRLHLYAVRGDADNTYVAGEQGTTLRLDAATGRFIAMNAPYKGSFFGVAVQKARVIVYGLKGHALMSEDRGHTWLVLETGTTQSIVGSAVDPRGHVLFATQGGRILRLRAKDTRLSEAGTVKAGEVFGMASAGDGRTVMATSAGPKAVQLGEGS
jgi:photosystem II stability/assembly factor-like uncharacterized protein